MPGRLLANWTCENTCSDIRSNSTQWKWTAQNAETAEEEEDIRTQRKALLALSKCFLR